MKTRFACLKAGFVPAILAVGLLATLPSAGAQEQATAPTDGELRRLTLGQLERSIEFEEEIELEITTPIELPDGRLLQRSQPVLPMGLGDVEGVTHDYLRHGTTTLFAALDVGTGRVLSRCNARHRHQEYLSFLRHIDAHGPADLDVHLVVDNYATHKHATVKAWLAKRPRYHVHDTPPYATWISQVERWFGIITEQAIRRGSFNSTKELIRRIDDFVEQYNEQASPFVWTATAPSILAKVERLCSYIAGTAHYTSSPSEPAVYSRARERLTDTRGARCVKNESP